MDLAVFQKTTKWAQVAIAMLLVTTSVDVADWLFVSGQVFYAAPALIDFIIGVSSVTDFAILALMIVNLRWIFVAAKFYQQRAPEGQIRPNWAVWSNFIPFMNLWSPYVQIKRIWGVSAATRYGYPTWLHVWWAAWVFQFFAALGIVIFIVNFEDVVTLGEFFRYVTPIFIIIDVLGMVLFYRVVTIIGGAHTSDAEVFT